MQDPSDVPDELRTDDLDRRNLKEKVAGWISGATGVVGERSLTKATKVLNRLKKFYAESNIDSILVEIQKLDLGPYMEEVVSSFVDAFKGMKLRDIPKFLELFGLIFSRYRQIGELFFSVYRKQLDLVVNESPRLRLYSRVLMEMYLLELAPRTDSAIEVLSLVEKVYLVDPNGNCSVELAVNRLSAFLQWLEKYRYCIPLTVSAPSMHVVSSVDFSSKLSQIVLSYMQLRAKSLIDRAISDVTHQEEVNKRVRVAKGELDEETKSRYDSVLANLEKSKNCMKSICLIFGFDETLTGLFENPINETPPPLDDDVNTSCISESVDQASLLSAQFSDEIEASFYSDLLDLKVRLPQALLDTYRAETSSSSSAFDSFLSELKLCNTRDSADYLACLWFETPGLNCVANRKKLLAALLVATGWDVYPSQARFLAEIHPWVRQDVTDPLLVELRKRAAKGKSSEQYKAIKFLAELCKFKSCPVGPLVDLLEDFSNDLNSHRGEMAAGLLVACGRYLINEVDVKPVVEAIVARIMKLKETASRLLPVKVQLALDDAYWQTKPRFIENNATDSLSQQSALHRYIAHLIQVELYRMDEDELLALVRRLPFKQAEEPVEPILRHYLLHSPSANFHKTHCVASLLAGLIKYKERFVVSLVDDVLEQFQIGIEREDFRQSQHRIRLAKLIGEFYAFRLLDAQNIFDVLYQLIGFRDASAFGAGDRLVLKQLWQESLLVKGGQGKSANSDELLDSISEELDDSSLENDESKDVSDSKDTPPVLKHYGVIDEPHWSNCRVHLVCSLLETCGEFIGRAKYSIRLKNFLVLFRMYLLRRAPLSVGTVNMVNDCIEWTRCLKKFDVRKDTWESLEKEFLKLVESLEKLSYEKETDESLSEMDKSMDLVEVSDVEDSGNENISDGSDSDGFRANEPPVVDSETTDFDKQFQAMMMESVLEARSSFRSTTGQGFLAIPKKIINSDPVEPPIPGSFRVVSKTMPAAASTIYVPEDHKLCRGQANYQAEKREADKEKQRLKKYILDYERVAAGGEIEPPRGKPVWKKLQK